ncbi:MAG: ABC transporter substrate-binding protein [Desulfocapsaceae bacterium]|nr:ABC transporter substrate-binding protein [Desulfocapsaceae bacterium]
MNIPLYCFGLRKRQYCRLLLAVLLVMSGWHPASAAILVDQEGTSISYDVPFKRIISLYPAHTENLLALGLNQELIGVTAGDDDPAIPGRPQFSANDTSEKFIAAKPDLILIRPMISRSHPQLVKQLQEAGIVLVSLQPTTIEEMFSYWQSLGELTGRANEAATMIQAFRSELTALQKTRDMIPVKNRPRVYFESIHAKMKTFAPSSMAVFVLENGGGVNVAADATARHSTNIAAYGKERILSHAAEIDIYLAQQGQMNQVTKEMITEEPGFKAIKAVREGRIFLINEELVSRPTMHLLEGIRQVRKMLYPEN